MKTTGNKNIWRNSLSKKVWKSFIYLLIAIVLLLLIALVYLYLNKEDLSRNLLDEFNSSQNGEVTVEKISLAPFEQFPDFSIRLSNVAYYENASLDRNIDEKPFCRIKNIFLSFDLIDLLNRDINILKITLKSGYFRIVTYQDSTTNLSNAFSLKIDSSYYKKIEEIDTVQLTEENNKLKSQEESKHFLSIEDLTIKDVTLEFENKIFKRKSSILIEQFKASFNHKNKMNSIRLISDLELNYYKLNNRTILKNNLVHIATDFVYYANNKLLTIEPSNIGFDRADFDFAGSFDIDDGDIDIQINGSDKNFSILALLLKDNFLRENRKNLIKGNYYFDGIVKGKIYNETPKIELSFGADDVDLNMVRIGRSINDLNFDAYFTTGSKKDLTEAYIKFENFSAQLPSGSTNGSLLVKNLTDPKVKLNWHLKTDLTGFEDIFRIDAIDSLGGIITIDADIDGKVNLNEGRIIGDKNNVEINFENVSITIPDAISLDKINGIIKRESDNFKIDNLKASIWGTDILLNGQFNKILSLIFNIESGITANLHLVSEKFNLPEVFSFDPSIGESFDHTLNNLDLRVNAKSTTSRLMNFDSFPAIDFHIESMNAEFNDFPDIKLVNSDLSFYDDTTGFNIKFNPLNAYGANGHIVLIGAYNGSAWKPYSLISDAKMENLDMLDLLNQFEMELDSASFFNSIFNGSFNFRLEFPKDSLIFKTLKMADADLLIYDLAGDDTVITKSLTIDFKDIYYDLNVDSNPMATLTTSGFYEAGRFRTNSFDIRDMRHDVSVESGLYEIIPRSKSIFGADGNGVFIARPWGKPPSYQLKYSVSKFDVQNLLESFLEDSLLAGKMSLDLNLKMIGDNWDSLKNKLNGTINLEGNDLLLYGVDTDELLRKIERSQNFTLLDVGAVLLTGPVGLAVTKGADVAVLVVTSPGKVTNIPKLVSDWEIKNGIISIKDVAFSTKKNRVAAKGYLNLTDQTMNITFGVLNKDGSLKLSQNIYGKFGNPEFGKINMISTVLSPVTNLWNSVFQVEGDIFYNGSVKQPE
ncbi:Alanyl-tRNA synthetase [hydrothermal vent metagenome]|uniref:Alanyl-tRNA synthetase n=1 Tax=hydrothermal vent metagenome TaxID=652676 RepID=A0A3B1CUC6_9ZZZZ